MATNHSTMRGLWLEDGELSLRHDLPVPRPAPGEALIRVTRAGICATDTQLQRGYYPFTGVLGHEFTGRVIAGSAAWLDQRVVGEINVACQSCVPCRQGRPRHCARREVLGIRGRHGAFAEYLTLPEINLHRVADTVSDDAAVFTEPLAAALRVRQQVEMRSDDRVLIVGDGKLGQLVTRALRSTGCRLTVLGRHASKLQLARDAGARAVKALPSDRRFDVAIDCSGNPDGFAAARAALRPAGTLVMKSTYAGELRLPAASVVVDELRLVGSRCGPFGPALELLERGEIAVEPLIEARYGLERALEAFAHAQRRRSLKVLLDNKLS